MEINLSLDAADQIALVVRLLAALVFGSIIGLERGYQGHRAGLRTHILISLASALFTIVSLAGFGQADPSRVAAQIVTGVGFLGAGAIMQRKTNTFGLTTAASIWTAAALGMAAGSGLLIVGLAASILVLAVLTLLRPIGQKITDLQLGSSSNSGEDEDEPNAR